MSASGRAVVVGAGVVGTACAYYLAKSGWKVTVVDRGQPGEGCSYGNCGLVCPSHVLPLSEPGAVWKALKTFARRDSPLRIKPRFSPTLWRWLFDFARRCNRRDMLAAGRAKQPLLESSHALYQELAAGPLDDFGWRRDGGLYVFRTAQAFDEFGQVDRLLRDEFNLPAEPYTGARLEALEPSLRPGLAGGWFYPGDAHVRPDLLMAAWRRAAEGLGVLFVFGRSVQGWKLEAGRIQSAVAHGLNGRAPFDLEAELFVTATGAMTPEFAGVLGCRVPIQPGKGYSLTMARPASCPSRPLLFPEHKVVATPWADGYRLGSTMEFAGYDSSLSPARLRLLQTGAEPYLKTPYVEPIAETWYGWRPMTPDGLPLIGWAPAVGNLLVAAGHGMLGVSLAPATGRLTAELASGVSPHVDPRPYAPGRFSRP